MVNAQIIKIKLSVPERKKKKRSKESLKKFRIRLLKKARKKRMANYKQRKQKVIILKIK